MTRFVRNPDGAVHSVPDDFEFPKDADGEVIGDWQEASEADASPELLGHAKDPQVEAAELHDLASADDPSLQPLGEVPVEPEVPMTAEEVARVEATAAEAEQTPAPAETPDGAAPTEAVAQ
ncbi:hypothetical protein [Leifsonia sp. TF02-11]|uniref:hypothetical protein n=1 Tax=Leifsonia sp. TF02-11 TaxID=2815212 RepID=UPI001AA0E031|nr:hypothetical protein [Leifsonia sp. TF02-11]MBO1739672.1 hypothetical protein [Leifsonia sp. TF02-11]